MIGIDLNVLADQHDPYRQDTPSSNSTAREIDITEAKLADAAPAREPVKKPIHTTKA
jgi:hypothetical protein